ncbi:MAG TPA: hypothetical protein VGC90_07530, partial [Candidatus Limnocylindrales bacterium]
DPPQRDRPRQRRSGDRDPDAEPAPERGRVTVRQRRLERVPVAERLGRGEWLAEREWLRHRAEPGRKPSRVAVLTANRPARPPACGASGGARDR